MIRRGVPWWCLLGLLATLVAFWQVQGGERRQLVAARERLAGSTADDAGVLASTARGLESLWKGSKAALGFAPNAIEMREDALKQKMAEILARQAREPRILKNQRNREVIPAVHPLAVGDPKYLELVRHSRRVHWLLVNRELAAALQLSPEAALKWAEIQVEREVAFAEVGAKWNQGAFESGAGLSGEERNRFSEERSQTRTHAEAEIRVLLGEEGFAEFRDRNSASAGTDHRVTPTIARAEYANVPLTELQIRQLRAMNAASRADIAVRGMSIHQQNDEFLERAAALLSPEQLVVARQWIRDWKAWQEEAASLSTSAIAAEKAKLQSDLQAKAAAQENGRSPTEP